jgi:hypothetical protein
VAPARPMKSLPDTAQQSHGADRRDNRWNTWEAFWSAGRSCAERWAGGPSEKWSH